MAMVVLDGCCDAWRFSCLRLVVKWFFLSSFNHSSYCQPEELASSYFDRVSIAAQDALPPNPTKLGHGNIVGDSWVICRWCLPGTRWSLMECDVDIRNGLGGLQSAVCSR